MLANTTQDQIYWIASESLNKNEDLDSYNANVQTSTIDKISDDLTTQKLSDATNYCVSCLNVNVSRTKTIGKNDTNLIQDHVQTKHDAIDANLAKNHTVN